MFTSTASSITKMSALVSGVGTDAAIYDDPQDADIPTLLDSRYDADKAQGLKRLIALMAQGRDVSNFFPQVVKGVASQSLEVKKLVYIYLVHYADKRPDEALLSINSFQRDLSDINPVVRAWALRAMSGIKVRAVIPLVIMAANKCARDPSPYVRRCSANAVSKIHSMGDEQHFEALVELVSILLNDNSAGVVGAAAAAYSAVCPEEYSLLRSTFRKLCGSLSDSDEWGQVALMDILMRYCVARHGITRNHALDNLPVGQNGGEFFQADLEAPSPEVWELRLLLSSTLPLLWSQNSAVVLQAATIYWFFSPIKELSKIVKPLLFLLRSSYDAQHVVLANILSFSKSMSSLFEAYYEDFYVRSSDSQVVRALKLDILTSIVTDSTVNQILQELEAYMRNTDIQFAADAVNAIGRCAVRLSSTALMCTKGLLALATKGLGNSRTREQESQLLSIKAEAANDSSIGKPAERGNVVIQAVLALRAIVQKHPTEQDQVLLHLLHNMNHIVEPTAREVVIWMLGEHKLSGSAVPTAIPAVLQYLAKTFVHEADGTKLQILNCISKAVLSNRLGSSLKTLLLILQYVLNLADCDLSYDIRDRARMIRILLGGHLRFSSKEQSYDPELLEQIDTLTQQSDYSKIAGHHSGILSKVAMSMFLCQKSVPVLPTLSSENSSFLPGSISHIVQHMAPGYKSLPREKSLDSPRSSPSAGEEENQSAELQSEYSDSVSERSVSGDALTTSSAESYSEGKHDSSDGRDGHNRMDSKMDLISLSDSETLKKQSGEAASSSVDDAIVPSVDLESWLGPEESSKVPAGFVPVSFKTSNWEPKQMLMLDFTNGDGLEVHYRFTRNPSIYSVNMVCLRLFMHNKSMEPLTGISISNGASVTDQTGFECGTAMVIPPQVIARLEPGERTECNAHIDFRHNLNSIRMSLHCNSKKFPVKVSPEAGALLRPRKMSVDAFVAAKSLFSGMHRSSREVTVKVAESASNSDRAERISKAILSAANVWLVGAFSREPNRDLVLYYSAETLTGSLLCLISISLETSSMVGTLKVSCDDTLFGLALLNQLDKSLVAVET